MKYHYLDTGTADRYPDSQCETGDLTLSLDGSNELIQQLPTLATEGWGLFPLMDAEAFQGLYLLFTDHVRRLILPHQALDETFTLEKYHEHVSADDVHYAVSSWALLPDVMEPFYTQLKARVEALTGVDLALKEIEHRNEKGTFLGFRIVRPGKVDYSPIHRDAWLPYWRNTLNVWLPICGFGQANTMCVLPRSHRIPDSEILKTKKGASIQGRTYHVPAAVALQRPFEQVKPELHPGEALIFSPYLLHGNGINNHAHETRVSLEIRFCLKKP